MAGAPSVTYEATASFSTHKTRRVSLTRLSHRIWIGTSGEGRPMETCAQTTAHHQAGVRPTLDCGVPLTGTHRNEDEKDLGDVGRQQIKYKLGDIGVNRS